MSVPCPSVRLVPPDLRCGRSEDRRLREPQPAQGGGSACAGLPSHAALQAALAAAQNQPNGGFGLEMWASVVNRDGVVCAVAFTGGNRVISGRAAA